MLHQVQEFEFNLNLKVYATVASSHSSYATFVCMPPDSMLLLLREPEVALVPLVEGLQRHLS